MPENTNYIDWSATAAWIALAISIITPFLTCIVNALYQTHLKKMELRYKKENQHYQKQAEVFQKLICLSTTGFHSGYVSDHDNYIAALNETYLFFPPQHRDLLVNFEDAYNTHNQKSFEAALHEISKIMGEILQEQSVHILE